MCPSCPHRTVVRTPGYICVVFGPYSHVLRTPGAVAFSSAGFTDVLTKPVDWARLRELLDAVPQAAG